MATRAARAVGNLPADATSFVDRQADVAAVDRLLARARLVTLTGVAGVGKSRLAVRAARTLRRFPDGAWMVELGPLRNPALLPHAVVEALRIENPTGVDPMELLIDVLYASRMLLILDNCEHLADRCAWLSDRLLRRTARLRILATSREELRVGGERVYPVQPLPIESAGQAPGVDLFAQRAVAVRPDFAVTDENRPVVVTICRRFDGIPLAIELAAARLRDLSVGQVADQLDDRFALLDAVNGRLPRWRTLRAAVDWSYQLCDPAARTVWARAAVFAGGFDLSAAEAVCGDGGIGPDEVLEAVDGLLAKSILTREQQADVPARYRLLETLRQYGWEKLRESGQHGRARNTHAEHYRRLVTGAEEHWFGPGQVTWVGALDQEHDNLRAALDFLLGEQPGAALDMAGALWFHWLFFGRLAEGWSWLERALARAPEPTAARARALWAAASLASTAGRLAAAKDLATQSRDLALQVGDRLTAAAALARVGTVLMYQREPSAAAISRDALAELDAIGHADSAEAVMTRLSLAGARLNVGDLSEADGLSRQSIEICQARGDETLIVPGLIVLTQAGWLRHDLAEAAGHARMALRLPRIRTTPVFAAQVVEVLAWIAQSSGSSRRAATLLGAANRMWQRVGISRSIRAPHYAGPHERCEADARAVLGDATFQAAFADGRARTLDEIVHMAVEEPAG